MTNNNSISAIVDRTRSIIRELSDNTSFEDELIYALLLDSRNILLYRHLRTNRLKSKLLYKTICMPLELSSQIPCDCIPDFNNCKALKTKFKIPKYMTTSSYETLKISTLDGITTYTLKDISVGKLNKYSRVKNKPYLTIYNEYGYLIGYPNNTLKAVLLQLIPEDPIELDEINLCTETEETSETCFNPLTDTFNIEGHLVDAMIKMTLEKLGIAVSRPEDTSNNAESVPNQLSY